MSAKFTDRPTNRHLGETSLKKLPDVILFTVFSCVIVIAIVIEIVLVIVIVIVVVIVIVIVIQCDDLQPCKKFLLITCDKIIYRG